MPCDIESEELKTLRAKMEREENIRRVVRLLALRDGSYLYMIETTFSTFPKFVIGVTDAAFESVYYQSRCGLLETAETAWARIVAKLPVPLPIVVHELKTWPEFFDAIATDQKSFEIRRNDRGFKVGDVLRLLEFMPTENRLTGKSLVRRVTYMTDFEQKPGFIVMGLAPADFPT